MFEFDVMISFAGAEREYARAIYDIMTANGARMFLDEEFQGDIWGKHLVEYLDEAYREKGRYVLILISASYTENIFANVERKAALDRMIREKFEYILPVIVDDSWIGGLPKSTAYLDLRVEGVMGICEVLSRKLDLLVKKIVVPPSVFIPRIPAGKLPAHLLAKYLIEYCNRREASVFGVLIYNEENVALKKLLRDQDYWDALDKASGPNMEIFGVRDTEKFEREKEAPAVGFMEHTSLGRSGNRGFYFSHLLKEYFGEEKTCLAYPSVLIFIIEEQKVRYCRLIPLRRKNSISETFDGLLALFTTISDAIAIVHDAEVSADALWREIKAHLIEDYTLYIQNAPADACVAINRLSGFFEA